MIGVLGFWRIGGFESGFIGTCGWDGWVVVF